MKKIIGLILTVIMMFSITNLAFASTTTTDSSDLKTAFSPETVITEDNLNDILKYYGLDPSAVIKLDKPVLVDVTVRDLEKAIEEAKKLPKTITIKDDHPTNVKVTDIKIDNLNAQAATTGTATVGRDNKITDSLYVYVSATGKFYKNGTTKYWTEALGAGFEISALSSVTTGYYYLVDKKSLLKNTLYNGSTNNSYLRAEYNCDVGTYLGIKGSGIRIATTNINGSTYFYSSEHL